MVGRLRARRDGAGRRGGTGPAGEAGRGRGAEGNGLGGPPAFPLAGAPWYPLGSVLPAPEEGVIRFRATHHRARLDAARYARDAARILRWRDRLRAVGLVGQDPARYGGAGFGNLSVRVDRGFLITGTQTGGRPGRHTDLDDLCLVVAWDPAANAVESFGAVLPSSESMTHGVVYDAAPGARYVYHAHAPAIWRRAPELGLPVTDPDIGYGTSEMAAAVRGILQAAPDTRLLSMGGHQDGVIAFGADPDTPGEALLEALRAAGGR